MPSFAALLKQLDLPELQYLGEGMQCVVFADGNDSVVKIYDAAAGKENLQRLMQFYRSLDTTKVSWQTPKILSIDEVKGKLVVAEQRLLGISPTRDYFKRLPIHTLKVYFTQYVDALFSVQNIHTDFLNTAEPLDLSGDFFEYRPYRSWQDLLQQNLERKLKENRKYYLPFVPHLNALAQQLMQKIDTVNLHDCRLIHGDFFPGNTIINEAIQITGLLDFGTFTTMGDPIYDIALGWVFADMYENIDHFPVKDFVGERINRKLAENEVERMKLYVLIYSLLSATMYGNPDTNDGHFRWAMKNLNDKTLLEAL